MKIIITLLIIFSMIGLILAATTNAKLKDKAQKLENNKFRSRMPASKREINDNQVNDVGKQFPSPTCSIGTHLIWTSDLGNPIHYNPLVADLDSDGEKEIIIATENHFIEVIKAQNGEKAPGWPFSFSSSSFLASPLLYDVDQDGKLEILVTTLNGEIVFLNTDGIPLYNNTIKIPKLKVREKWYEGLDNMAGNDIYMDLHAKSTKGPFKKPQKKKEETKQKKVETRSQTNIYGADQGKITDEAIESLDIFLSTSVSGSYLRGVQYDPLKSNVNEDPAEEKGHILLPPHVLSTPVISDLDGDGTYEIIVAVSYYFDPQEETNLPQEIETSKYVAGGIVVMDINSKKVKWQLELDLTTDNSSYTAYLFSSPTVIDLDGDKKQEIIIGTGVGFIYVIDSNGGIISPWPLVADSISSQVVVEDVNKDGKMEIIVIDNKDNLICYSHKGEELWEMQIKTNKGAKINQHPTIGDVDGDGDLDVVIGTKSGHVWAVNGRTGKVVPGYPFKVGGEINSPIQLMKLDPSFQEPHLIFHSNDGHIYNINGKGLCFDKIEIGEKSTSSIVVDDLSGHNKMDLLVLTNTGRAFCVGTNKPYKPETTWVANWYGASNVHTENSEYHGIYVESFSRRYRDIVGSSFSTVFTITDQRKMDKSNPSTYHVEIFVDGKLKMAKYFANPGVYIWNLPSPSQPKLSTIILKMTNEKGQIFFDYYTLSFNQHFAKTFKWVLVVPFFVLSAIILYVKEVKSKLPIIFANEDGDRSD